MCTSMLFQKSFSQLEFTGVDNFICEIPKLRIFYSYILFFVQMFLADSTCKFPLEIRRCILGPGNKGLFFALLCV